MKAPVKQHDWSVVNEWFNRRCDEFGLSKYERYAHTEILTVELPDSSLAEQLGYAAGKSIADLLKSEE